MKNQLTKFLLVFTFLFLFLFSPINILKAQDDNPFGIDDMDLVLDQDLEPRSAIVNIINIALGFLGLIAVIVVIYGGFVWMTSGGSADKVDRAKKILKNGLIGLILILLSWGIVTFIINQFSGSGGVTTPRDPAQPGFDPGFGALGNCALESVYPEPNQKDVPRNTIIILTFKEAVDPSSVCVTTLGGDESCDCSLDTCSYINTNVFEITADHFDGKLENAGASLTDDKKTIVISPNNFLGLSTGDTNYTVRVNNNLEVDGEDDKKIFDNCSSQYFIWNFQVSDKIDLTPPIVVSGGIFPPPDNLKDDKVVVEPAKATGRITVLDCPNYYQAASLESYSKVGVTEPNIDINVNPNYSHTFVNLTVTIPDGTTESAVLSVTDGQSLGLASLNNNTFSWPNYLSISLDEDDIDDLESGNSWNISVNRQVLSDTLKVGSINYSFVNTEAEATGNRIYIPSCDILVVIENIVNKINNNDPEVLVKDITGNQINLEARIGGASGNNIELSTNNSSAFDIEAMSGGVNEGVNYIVNDLPDQPMNTTIQINFNKAMNPITLSGPSNVVEEYIRVLASEVNEDGEIIPDTEAEISGTFSISNGYRTVEFISDFECGTNACGGKIYCLPGNSNLEIELEAASFRVCNIDDDCQQYSPFSNCNLNVCQDNNGDNLPTANADGGFDGIMDTSLNSLDGNRSGTAEGPVNYYDENEPNPDFGDNYKWSFFTNDEINLDPPRIVSIYPGQTQFGYNGTDPIEVTFDSLMRNSTLRTGSVVIPGPSGDILHRRVNLWSSARVAGYWIRTQNIDSTFSGFPDQTKALINHSPLASAITWHTQVGSGVENIYQNCFKPSAGVYNEDDDECDAHADAPSCCFGDPALNLDINGNCL